MFSSTDKYNDIINMPHHVSKTHPQMSLEARSAQFAPFAALTGYGDVINETGRLTNEKIEIDDELKEILNEEIMKIKSKLSERLTISFTYFKLTKQERLHKIKLSFFNKSLYLFKVSKFSYFPFVV